MILNIQEKLLESTLGRFCGENDWIVRLTSPVQDDGRCDDGNPS